MGDRYPYTGLQEKESNICIEVMAGCLTAYPAHLPGQSCVLHSCISSRAPTHGSPPYRSAIKSLRRDLVPLPQDLLHSFQFDQANHTQGSERESAAIELVHACGYLWLGGTYRDNFSRSSLWSRSFLQSSFFLHRQELGCYIPVSWSVFHCHNSCCSLSTVSTYSSLHLLKRVEEEESSSATLVPLFLSLLLPKTHLDSGVCCTPLSPSALPGMDLLHTSHSPSLLS